MSCFARVPKVLSQMRMYFWSGHDLIYISEIGVDGELDDLSFLFCFRMDFHLVVSPTDLSSLLLCNIVFR